MPIKYAKTDNQQIYDFDSSIFKKQCESECCDFIDICNNAINLTASRRKSLNNVVNACKMFINEADSVTKLAAKDKMQAVFDMEREVMKAISSKIHIYKELCNCQIAETEHTANDRCAKISIESINHGSQPNAGLTEHEAKQQLESCEIYILSAYNKFKNAARDVVSAGYNAARFENAHIKKEAIEIMIIKTAPALLIPFYGLVLSVSPIGPEWWITIFLVGIAVAFHVFPAVFEQTRMRIDEASSILHTVDRQLSDFNDILEQNNFI